MCDILEKLLTIVTFCSTGAFPGSQSESFGFHIIFTFRENSSFVHTFDPFKENQNVFILNGL